MNFLNFIVIFLTLSEADGKVTIINKKKPQSYNDYSFNLQSPATKTIFLNLWSNRSSNPAMQRMLNKQDLKMRSLVKSIDGNSNFVTREYCFLNPISVKI